MEGRATQTETAGLRALSREAIPAALEKARHYRLLNEPELAESICLDVVEVDPSDQRAWIELLLARTDQFAQSGARALQRAREVLPRIEGEYARAYYGGLIHERHAKTLLRRRTRQAGVAAWDEFQRAFALYEEAIGARPAGDDDAILRWNTCVRLIERNAHCRPETRPHQEPAIE